jgi:hypothetical protein
MLIASAPFFVSYRLKSAVPFGFDVPPSIVSRATCVEAADLGTRGHEPYQLRVLGIYHAVRNEVPCAASVDLRSPARKYNGTHACLDPCTGIGVPLPLPPGLGVGGLSSSVAEARGWGDLDEDCNGMADGGAVGVRVGIALFDPAAGLGLTRLREPMAQIERGEVRVSVGWTVQGVVFSTSVLVGVRAVVGVVGVVYVVGLLPCRCVVCLRGGAEGPGRSRSRSWLQFVGFQFPRLYVIRLLGCIGNQLGQGQALRQTAFLAWKSQRQSE